MASSTTVRFPFRVLSLDGGGLRGILPATVLVELEKLTGLPLAKQFDLIVGTSTGGILALGLSVAGDDGEPIYSADQLRQLYFDNAETIFPLGGMPRFHASGLWGLGRSCRPMQLCVRGSPTGWASRTFARSSLQRGAACTRPKASSAS